MFDGEGKKIILHSVWDNKWKEGESIRAVREQNDGCSLITGENQFSVSAKVSVQIMFHVLATWAAKI